MSQNQPTDSADEAYFAGVIIDPVLDFLDLLTGIFTEVTAFGMKRRMIRFAFSLLPRSQYE